MADPPATPAQGPGDRRRAAPPAFAAPVGNPFASPPQPVTPSPPPPLPSFSSSSRVGSSSDEKPVSAVVQAESQDYSASPAETQESSTHGGYSNGSRERSDADQRSDGKSSPSSHGLSNGGGFSGGSNDGSVQRFQVPAVPMGPPPSSQFTQPSHFASPLRPIPSFNAVASSPVRSSSTFSEIPLVPGTPPARLGANHAGGNADQPLYSGVTEDEFDASSFSASTSFVLFSAQTVDTSFPLSRSPFLL